MPVRVFISHAAADETLAAAVVDCLLSTIMIDDSEVRCTSVAGHKLPVGSNTAETLRDDLDDTSVVVGLLTPGAIDSGWVLFELGAAWGAKKNLVPLLAGKLAFRDLPGPLAGHHAIRLDDINGLTQALDEIAVRLGIEKRKPAKVSAAISKLAGVAEQFQKAARKSVSKVVQKAPSEPSYAGMPFSELWDILTNENINIPAKLTGGTEDAEMSLGSILLANYKALGDGVRSNASSDTAEGFLYQDIALALLPYKLVKFDKLTAVQAKWYKRLMLSDDGHSFIAHANRRTHAGRPKAKA
jgi:hypothetical protein